MKELLGHLVTVILIFFVFISFIALSSQNLPEKKEVSPLELIQMIKEGKVEELLVKPDTIEAKSKNQIFWTKKDLTQPGLEFLFQLGLEKEDLQKVKLKFKPPSGISGVLLSLLFPLLTFLLLGLLFLSFMKRAQGSAMKAFDFTQAKARIFGKGGLSLKEKVTFKDVAGLEEAKEELKEVVDFLKNTKKYLRMGARIPRGILLSGPPGTGKTLLAKAVAGEANVPFFSISGSEFVELFVGVGAARVRSLFAQAKRFAPSIIFIDELDAIGRRRGVGLTGVHEEREQALNQILVEMDGFERDERVIVLAATNRPDVLDPALLRPGRFDRRINIDLPDLKEREAILKIHSRGKPLAEDVNLREIAERTPGFSGADLANLMNEAAILAARRNKEKITQAELFEAIEKVLLGPERKSFALSEKEKKIAAYHEAGHAIVAEMLPGGEPVRKVSIVSRGFAAGYTLRTPSEERKFKTKKEFIEEIAILLGGYCAEELVFKDVTTGASSDLQKASFLARKLVKEYGMSKLGPISFSEPSNLTPWEKEYSEEVAFLIDKEVANIIKQAKQKATKVLKENKKLLDELAKILIDKEVIEEKELKEIIKKFKKS